MRSVRGDSGTALAVHAPVHRDEEASLHPPLELSGTDPDPVRL